LASPYSGEHAEIRDDERHDEVEPHLDARRGGDVAVHDAVALVDPGQHEPDDRGDPCRAPQRRASAADLDGDGNSRLRTGSGRTADARTGASGASRSGGSVI